MGVVVEALLGVRDADLFEDLDGASLTLSLVDVLVEAQRLLHLHPDREDRVQGGHRLLEDHRDVLPAHRAHLLIREGEEVALLVMDRP